mgnify:CR=1 FL=1
MNKNQIFIKSGTEYKKMTKELLTESNLAELIGDRNKMVGIKPNLVSPSDPSEGGTTHPEIVAGILEYLKENGFNPEHLVVERNYEIIPKEQFASVTIQDEDEIEVLRFVGGG